MYQRFLQARFREAIENFEGSYILKAGKDDVALLNAMAGKAKVIEGIFARGFTIQDKKGEISMDYSVDEYVAGRKQALKRAIVDRYFPKAI